MEIVYKEEQICLIARKLNLPKNLVSGIINNYIYYLRGKLDSGKTVKFLDICYLRVDGNLDNGDYETLAYISSEIGSLLSVGSNVVYRVLRTFEDSIIETLKEDNGCSIRGLVRIRLNRTEDGEGRVRIRKSTAFNNFDVYIITLGSFKRKVSRMLSYQPSL